MVLMELPLQKFDADMKIGDLKEFQSKAGHYFPYGDEKIPM
jgi:hypothetical protein